MNHKPEKIKSLIKERAAEYISRNSTKKSLITVTNVDLSPDYKKSTIYISVLPDDLENEAVQFLKRKRGDFHSFVTKETKLRIIPRFDFEIDKGEKARQRFEEILRKDT